MRRGTLSYSVVPHVTWLPLCPPSFSWKFSPAYLQSFLLFYRTVLLIWSSFFCPLEISEKHFSSSLHVKLSINQRLQFLMFVIREQTNIMGWLLFKNDSGIGLVYGWAGMWLEPGRQVKIILRVLKEKKKKWKKPKLIYWLSSQSSAFLLSSILPFIPPGMRWGSWEVSALIATTRACACNRN